MKTNAITMVLGAIFSILMVVGIAYPVMADPGQVTVQGTLYYADRNNITRAASYATVELYDRDSNGYSTLLRTTTTDVNGYFQFPALTNSDDYDPGDPNPNLDLFVTWKTYAEDSTPAYRKVMDSSDQIYNWSSSVFSNVADGTVNFNKTIDHATVNHEAMWIFQDLRRAWEYVIYHTSPAIDPGSVTAIWEKYLNNLSPCNGSCFFSGTNGAYIFIGDDYVNSSDTVVHETGHHYMFNATGWWTWWDILCYSHSIFTEEDVYCAWSEGWADFVALPVNGDPCYDFAIGPCTGTPDQTFYNLETHTRLDDAQSFPWGDKVEGRVAGALYDLVDANSEAPGFDSANFGFGPIAKVGLQTYNQTFVQFWNNWSYSGQNFHDAVRAIYQNTIDYDYPPVIAGIPDVTVLQNLGANHILDLGNYSYDSESFNSELTYDIVSVSDVHCGVSLDGPWVNVAPFYGWLGSCELTVRVSDSIKTADDTFWIDVVPVAARIYMPYVSQQ